MGTDDSSASKDSTQSGSPRFRSHYDLRGLVSVVAAVARAAEPKSPSSVSQRRYDAARAAAGYADAPTAKQTAVRLGMSWKAVLALALDPTRSVDSVLGKKEGEEDQPWLTDEDVRAGLRIVARRLGKKTLKPVEYRLERRRMLDAAARARRHRNELSLPTEGQIERITGSWDEALAIAGLGPRPKAASGTAVPRAAVMELFLETFGQLPRVDQLEEFSRVQGIPLAKRLKPQAFYIAELARERADWGRWTPTKPLSRSKPNLDAPVPELAALLARFPTAQKRKKRWTRTECVEALVGLLAEWPNDRRLTENAYQEASRGRDDLPSLSSLQRRGGATFGELVEEARKRYSTNDPA